MYDPVSVSPPVPHIHRNVLRHAHARTHTPARPILIIFAAALLCDTLNIMPPFCITIHIPAVRVDVGAMIVFTLQSCS